MELFAWFYPYHIIEALNFQSLFKAEVLVVEEVNSVFCYVKNEKEIRNIWGKMRNMCTVQLYLNY